MGIFVEMIYKIKKKLIHFYTHGNIFEDFVSSRRDKVNLIRRIIRSGFYIHCVIAVLGMLLLIFLGTGLAAIPVVVSLLASAVMSLLAVGDMKPTKAISCCVDLLLSILWFVVGGFAEYGAPFIVCGVLLILNTLTALAVCCAGICRSYLESYSPFMVRREDYTMLRNFSDYTPPEEQEEIPPLPPLTSEMRELSEKLREILCIHVESNGETEEIITKSEIKKTREYE